MVRKSSDQKRPKSELPATFEPRFWESSDRRCAAVRIIRSRLERLRTDAGGHESYQRDLLCQRAAFLSIILETREVNAAEGKALDIGSYTQGINALMGLLRALGLQRHAKSIGSELSEYLHSKRAK